MNNSWVVSILILGLFACGRAPDSGNNGANEIGQGAERSGVQIAEAQCSSCHAIGLDGESPHPDAKPFRFFSENYPISDLAEALATGIYVGHPDMPVFRFEPDELEALIEHIESVQVPKEI